MPWISNARRWSLWSSACWAWTGLRRSGLFDRAAKAIGARRWGLVSWNARTLFAKDQGKARQKLNYISKFLKNCQIVMMQEAHGNALIVREMVHHLHLHTFGSFCESFNAAGVVVLVPHIDGWDISADEIVQGRVLRVVIRERGSLADVVLWNIYSLTSGGKLSIARLAT